MEMEEWKDITNSPNYEVSTFGNVRRKKTQRILKPQPCKNDKNYICYKVHIADINGKVHTRKIHRLVGLAFIANPENKTQIDHIDRNTANNRVENLRFATPSENCRNTGVRSDNTSGEKNIFKATGHKKYTLVIYNKHIGQYDTIADAVIARDLLIK